MFQGFMYQNGILKCNLIMAFKDIKIFKRGLVCASLLKENISLSSFLCKINSLSVELRFFAQTKEEEYKCDSNIAW